jgi:hypothetical protein
LVTARALAALAKRTATGLAASTILTSTPRFANRRKDPSPEVLGGGIHRLVIS